MNLEAKSKKKTPVKVNSLAHFLRFDPWLVVVLACFVIFAWSSWGKLVHPIIDVGREVTIPSRLVAGQVLYRDVNTYYGPLAYYANALALLLFGHHLEVFYAVGISLALGATLLVYRLAKRLTDARWAALCTTCVLIYCVFREELFNLIMPYSYGAVYAIVFCLLAFTAIDYYGSTGKLSWLLIAAIACGLAGISKQEYGVAALGGILVGANLHFSQNLWSRLWRSVLVILVASTCVLLPLALLAQQVPWEKLSMSLIPISKSAVLKKSILFQVSPAKTLSIWWYSFKIFAAASLGIWSSMIAGRWLSKSKLVPNHRWVRLLVEISAGVYFARFSLVLLKKLLGFSMFHPLNNMSWALPVLVGWFALNWPKLVRHKHVSLLWTLLVFSLLLNARWFFYINFYGLYAISVVLLFFTLFYHLALRTGASVWSYLLICLLIGGSLNLSKFGYYRHPIHSTYGTLYVRNADLALSFNQTISAINTSEATSVLVLPEGALLNFLTATHSPSRETTFLPSALSTSKAEQEFLAQMQTCPPELIVYVERPFREWGYQKYAEFNPLVDLWITHEHQLVDVFPKGEGAIIRIYGSGNDAVTRAGT